MDKEQFVALMDEIERIKNREISIMDFYKTLNADNFVITSEYDRLVRIASESVDDTGDWVEWWVYENDFGKKGMTASISGGKMREIETSGELYDFMKSV